MKIGKDAKEYIAPLSIDGLNGRILRMPSSKKSRQREIVFVYGTHSSLERGFGMAEDLSQYGNITTPDLPGFGGMDSFRSIGKKPELDNYADYLATFIKTHFGDKKITLVGFSLGWAIVTRTLQRYPKLCSQINLLVSYGGFSHREEYLFSTSRMRTYRILSKACSNVVFAFFFRHLLLNSFVLRKTYARTYHAKAKFENLTPKKKKEMIEFEIILWQINDVATWAKTLNIILNIDLTDKKIDIPVWQVLLGGDQYFDGDKVTKNLNKIFSQVHTVRANTNSHAPTVVANAKEAAGMWPDEIRKELERDV